MGLHVRLSLALGLTGVNPTTTVASARDWRRYLVHPSGVFDPERVQRMLLYLHPSGMFNPEHLFYGAGMVALVLCHSSGRNRTIT